MPIVTNFEIRKGTGPRLRFVLDVQESIVGWNTQWVLKDNKLSANAIATVNGMIANTTQVPLSSSIGVFDVQLTKGLTNLWSYKTYHWYFERIDDTFETVLSSGDVIIVPK